jgi:hypothetical protein
MVDGRESVSVVSRSARMRQRSAACVLWFAAVLFAPAAGRSQEPDGPPPRPAPQYEVRLEPSVPVPMRDGVRLSTDLYFPVGAEPPLPVVLIRTPYDKNRMRGARGSPRFFAGQGYVVAAQDVRGKFESEGWYTVSAADRHDGYDAVTWLAEQSWSNGRVGTYGCSYLGENQMQLAATRHPNHVAAIAQAAGGSYRYFGAINGGAFELAAGVGWFWGAGSKVHMVLPPGLSREDFLRAAPYLRPAPEIPEPDYRAMWRTLPLVDVMRRAEAPPTDWEDFVSHPPGDPWWDAFGYVTDADRFDVPTLHVNSWYDFGVAETLALFNLLRTNAHSARARDHQYAIVSPTTHCASEEASARTIVGERDLGDARLDYYRIYLRWFDRWLREEENEITEMPKVQLYVMGRNAWRRASAWPPPDARPTRYYLHSDGRANSRLGSGTLDTVPPRDEPPDGFVYDPATPVPSVGGPICCTGTRDAPAGAFDQSDVEMRHDVLVYTTAPLEDGVEVTGPVELTLYVSSCARDTDFTGKLVDVYPDGRAFNVQEGILRARYREGYRRTLTMRPGETYRITVNLHATSNYFAPGHRIRLEVSSSNFPRFDRNLNTGGNNYDETRWVTARNTVHHSAEYPSHLVLPVVRR